jgi:hypothetical protein
MAPAIEAVRVLSSVPAGIGNASRFPRPRGTERFRPAGPGKTKASARPGGGEAPAGGGAGTGQGFGPPAGQGSAWRWAKGDGPWQDAQGARRRRSFPLSGQAARATGTFLAPCQVSRKPGSGHKRSGLGKCEAAQRSAALATAGTSSLMDMRRSRCKVMIEGKIMPGTGTGSLPRLQPVVQAVGPGHYWAGVPQPSVADRRFRTLHDLAGSATIRRCRHNPGAPDKLPGRFMPGALPVARGRRGRDNGRCHRVSWRPRDGPLHRWDSSVGRRTSLSGETSWAKRQTTLSPAGRKGRHAQGQPTSVRPEKQRPQAGFPKLNSFIPK